VQPYVGTSGWAYKAWQPEFYPEKLPQTKFLEYYASRLTAVEVNYTFRHLLTEKTINNWLKQTPESFRFALKANQAITHFRKLGAGVEDVLGKFLSAIAPLEEAGRLGPVLFQLPPQMKASPEVLKNFLAMLPHALRAAFEFRHESWFGEETYAVLREFNAALCVAENDEMTTPDIETASFAYYRFRRSEYSGVERQRLAARVRTRAGAGEVFAFFKHEENPQSPLWAEELLQSLQRRAA
jgi:uncharacterized protein YecE (DUF72 family)